MRRSRVGPEELQKKRPPPPPAAASEANMTTVVLAPIASENLLSMSMSAAAAPGGVGGVGVGGGGGGSSRSVFVPSGDGGGSDGRAQARQRAHEGRYFRAPLANGRSLGGGGGGNGVERQQQLGGEVRESVRSLDGTGDGTGDGTDDFDDGTDASDEDSVFEPTALVRRYHPLAGSYAGHAPHFKNNWGGRAAAPGGGGEGGAEGEEEEEEEGRDGKPQPQSALSDAAAAAAEEPRERQRQVVAPPPPRRVSEEEEKHSTAEFPPTSKPLTGKATTGTISAAAAAAAAAAVAAGPNRPPLRSKEAQAAAPAPVGGRRRRIIFPTLHGSPTRRNDSKSSSSTSQVADEKRDEPSSSGGGGVGKSRHRRAISFDRAPVVPHGASSTPLESPVRSVRPQARHPCEPERRRCTNGMPSDAELLNALDARRREEARPPMSSSATDNDEINKSRAEKRSAKASAAAKRASPRPSPFASLSIPPFQRGAAAAAASDDDGIASPPPPAVPGVGQSSRPKQPAKSYFHSSAASASAALPPATRFPQQAPLSPPHRPRSPRPLHSILRTSSSSLGSSFDEEGRRRMLLRWGSSADDLLFPEAPPLSKVQSPEKDGGGGGGGGGGWGGGQGLVESVPSDLSVASSSSRASLRRVSSENNMASTQEKERRKSVGSSSAGDNSIKSAARKFTRHGSMENYHEKAITFDPRVWVVEYERVQAERNNWFTQAEMEGFKSEAIARIQRRHAAHLMLPTGTGRVIGGGGAKTGQRPAGGAARALFSDPALGIGCEEDGGGERTAPTTTLPSPRAMRSANEKRIQNVLLSEVRSVLIVDPHDMFLKLFAKAIRSMMDHVIVTTARSAEEALRRISAAQVVFPQAEGGATHGFDLIIVEERLQLFHRHSSGGGGDRRSTQAAGDDQNQRNVPASGSALLNQISIEQRSMLSSLTPQRVRGGMRPRFSLLLGVSAHLGADQDKLRRSGTDFVWGKPPPAMDETLRNELLRAILEKRGKPTNFIFD